MTEKFSKLSNQPTKKVVVLEACNSSVSSNRLIEYPHSEGKKYNVIWVDTNKFNLGDERVLPKLKISSSLNTSKVNIENLYITNKLDYIVKSISQLSNSNVPELQMPALRVIGELQHYKQNSYKSKFYELFKESQYKYNKVHFGVSGSSAEIEPFDFKDEDSRKLSLGSIIQFKSKSFFNQFIDGSFVKVISAPGGTNTDFLLATEYVSLCVDVKLLRTDIVLQEKSNGSIEMWDSSNDEIFLRGSKIVSLLKSNTNEIIKNPNPVILLVMDGYPSEECLKETEHFQNELNMEILPELKELDTRINPNLKIYFSFVGPIRYNNAASIDEVANFNLKVLKELPGVDDTYVENIIKMTLKQK